jgi:amino acid adenylation domain-containing protein
MHSSAEADRDFWRGMLGPGGFTTIPRWVQDSATGLRSEPVGRCDRRASTCTVPSSSNGSAREAEYEAKIPDDLTTASRRLAGELDMPLSSLLLAAHAKVLSALSGEREIVTGYVGGNGPKPLPCRLTTAAESWRELLLDTHHVEAQLLSHADFPLHELKRKLGGRRAAFETVFDPTDVDSDLGENTVLRLGIAQRSHELVLRLRYRTDLLDADYAARIAGYHLTALELMTADLDTEHRRQSLLSAEELRFQHEGLAGPRRELPDARAHQIFEQRVRAHPDRVAAVCGDRTLTYGQLNARANRLARALLTRGLRREGVVAVVTERNLDWLTAVLAVFKAGGVYLPIEPHFPADRIARMLSRAGCRLVLTEPGSTTTLDEAVLSLPDLMKLFIEVGCGEDCADRDLGMPITPDQLAYIYFTSGSTGEPKGAMCEHAGMVNHLFAKIDDLGVGADRVVAQTAPQCFDISLWQLVSALLVGGRTLIVEQEVILDVQRFVDKIIDGRVNVVQVVPSYLEVVLSYLDRNPRPLPDLRCVSVTGEALKWELAQRWFASQPQIKLVNAYGLTETSDDTNHEVMDQVPDSGRVPLGRPINNVQIQVVDEYLAPVPLGAPGEIVFSGVCVGRGYINDPERTRAAFLTDPDTGRRRYRSGDHGRWRPDGKLQFLGRRDSQLKIRGFRIEIGEIENTLLRVPGVRDGAVVVAERADQSKHLVAFYSGPQQLDDSELRKRLGESLPEYMIPSAFHWRERLPLTPNSKIDKKTLTALSAELAAVESRYDAPATSTERRLAAAWATVLGIPQNQIGRSDHFFDRGGTSLSAVKLAITLDRVVSLKEVTLHPILADLAGVVDGKSDGQSELLQALSESALSGSAISESNGLQTGALVCFPYAGGNAVNFQPMARALRDSGLAVYAVELPGHDVGGARESFAPLAKVVDRVVAEITRRRLTTVMLWGHSSGAALAVETARRLQLAGITVPRIFLGAQLLGSAADRRAALTELDERSNTEIAAGLSADRGYTELGELDAERAEHVGAAYRHDYLSANRYFAEVLDNPPSERLSARVTVVAASDDPATEGFRTRHRDWEVLAEHVELYELDDGGHYFLRTRPADAGEAVLRSVGMLASVSPAN